MKYSFWFLCLLLTTQVQSFEGDEYIEPVENYESYDEGPTDISTYPAQQQYPKKDFHVNPDESMPVEEYDEYSPVENFQENFQEEFQDYGGGEAENLDSPTQYESYDSTDY